MDTDDAFSEYAAGRWRVLVRTGVLLGCDLAEAEDLAQLTLLRCYLKWRHVERATDRNAYVARIQVNLLRTARRRHWKNERPTGEGVEAVSEDVSEQIDNADALMRALATLPETQRQAVVLRYYLHMSEQQAAEAAGVAAGTIKSRLSRALAAMAADPGLAVLREGPS